MTTQELMLAELEAAAARMSVKVTYESLQGGLGAGGLCRVRGEYRIIIDKRAQLGDRIATLAQGLAGFDLGDTELSPAARERVRLYAVRRAS
jgi:hypothetical protein